MYAYGGQGGGDDVCSEWARGGVECAGVGECSLLETCEYYSAWYVMKNHTRCKTRWRIVSWTYNWNVWMCDVQTSDIKGFLHLKLMGFRLRLHLDTRPGSCSCWTSINSIVRHTGTEEDTGEDKDNTQKQTHSTHGDSERRGGRSLHGGCGLIWGAAWHTASASCPFWRRLCKQNNMLLKSYPRSIWINMNQYSSNTTLTNKKRATKQIHDVPVVCYCSYVSWHTLLCNI